MAEIAIVEWVDSSGQDGWVDVDDIDPGAEPIISAGIVLEDTSEHITLTLAYCEHQVMHTLSIPYFAINNVEKMSVPFGE
ncbi:MAG: hypothetical protein AAF358_13460 [Pseudomonadota bacterium]